MEYFEHDSFVHSVFGNSTSGMMVAGWKREDINKEDGRLYITTSGPAQLFEHGVFEKMIRKLFPRLSGHISTLGNNPQEPDNPECRPRDFAGRVYIFEITFAAFVKMLYRNLKSTTKLLRMIF